jgi:archaemetzincin
MSPALALFLVCLAPLGDHDDRLVGTAARGVEHLYGVAVRRLPAAALPRAAWYPPRRRWRAERLLAHLDREVVPGSGCDVVLGFTSADVSTSKDGHPDWGVLGLATLGGTSGVVSTFRARRGARGDVLARRTVKVVNHELGHALGLPHHDGADCIMHDVRGSVRTVDGESGVLCARCRAAASARLRAPLPARERFDWRAVLR